MTAPSAAVAQGGPPPGLMNPPPAELDADMRSAVVEAAAQALRDGYVFIDVGEAAAAAIEAKLAAGDYDDLVAPIAFAAQVTADLYEVSHDKHLRITAPGSPPPSTDGAPPRMPPRSMGGIVRADRLADDVGYIEVAGFPDVGMFALGADPAMSALTDTRALVIDIRRNPGGTPNAVAYLVSHFIDDAEPVLINEFINRNRGTAAFETVQFWSTSTPTTYVDKPVYVLTSAGTFSGGEEFAYDMQALELGVLVGETTGGGANPGGGQPLAAGLGMFLPGGRAHNPITDANWEGVGVVPDIATPADEALEVALTELGLSPGAGDIDALSQERLFTPRTTQHPDTEAAVRRMIDELARGAPDYDLMTPTMQELTRQQLANLRAVIEPLGAVESVMFQTVGPMGADVYDVKLENGALRWIITLDTEGRIATAGFQPAPPAPPAPPAVE